nr:hypothetical protein [Tanacetum cinerariifolium]
MKAHLAPMQPTQVNIITSLCEICSGSHDTQYRMENLEQAFVEYASSHTNEAGGLVSNFMASQDARLSKFEADFKQQQNETTSKIDTMLKAIIDRMEGAFPSDMMERLELGKNGSAFVQGEVSTNIEDPRLFTLPCRLRDSKPFDILADLRSCINIIPLYLFKKLNIGLLKETDHIFGLANRTKSYPVGIVIDVEVHIGKLKLLTDFYVIDMKKDPECPLLVGRGFLTTANAVIDCRKAKIMVGEGITREIARDAKINPFKDVLVFRRVVEFLRALPINLKGNMWELKDLIKNPINWDKPHKDGDGAWHAKIRIIDLDGERIHQNPTINPHH